MNKHTSPFLLTAVFSLFLSSCGGTPSSFEEENLEPNTIDPIVVDSGEDGDTTGEVTIGGSLSEEELAALPAIDIPNRKFSDPGAVVTLGGVVTADAGANIVATLWEQTSGPAVDILNVNRLNTSIVVPVPELETLLTFRLFAQDDQGRVNSATTTVVVQKIENPLRVIGGVANEGDATVAVTIEIDEARATDTNVDYLTFDGTATSAVDYTEALGNVTIPAGETQVSVDVPLLAGDLYFDSESFFFQALTLRDDGTRSRSLGTILIRNASPAEIIEIPELEDLPQQIFTANNAVDGVLFNNASDTGDRIIECSSDRTLPPGLSLNITELGASCSIVGTPLTAVEAAEYVITAVNPAGESEATITIAVQADDNNIQPPEISGEFSPGPLNLNEEISPIIAFNNGGQQDLVCSSDALPAGLSVETVTVTEDIFDGDADVSQLTCQIVGTPTAVVEPTEFAVTASNSAGQSMWPIVLSVVEPFVPEAPNLEDQTLQLNYMLGQTISPLSFANTGGEILDCAWSEDSPVPPGLSLGLLESTCVLTGTPSGAGTFSTLVIASNEGGSDTLALEISVVAPTSTPILEDPAVTAIFTVGQFNYAEINNTGVLIDSCAAIDSLPDGISLGTGLFEDSGVCYVFGTPTATVDAQNYAIEVSFGDGEVQETLNANINLTIEAVALPPIDPPSFTEPVVFNLNQNEAFDPIAIDNTGGLLDSCSIQDEQAPWPGLDTIVLNGVCTLTGTPTRATSTDGELLTITGANEAGTDVLSASIIVAAQVPPFAIETPPEFNLTAGTFFLYTFETSGLPFEDCFAVNALPDGLALSVFVEEDDIPTCTLAGTPTTAADREVFEVQFTVDESIPIGSVDVSIAIDAEVVLQAPIITAVTDSASYIENVAIDTIVFPNSGGPVSACSTVPALPTGLSFTLVSPEGEISCALSGTATEPTPSTDYTLRFESSFEPVELVFSLQVDQALLAPVLSDLGTQNFELSELGIDELVFANSGGGELISCSSVPDIATLTPFSLTSSEDGATCVISGAPTTSFDAQSFVVTASNSAGSGTASITLSVGSAPVITAPTDSVSYTVNTEIDELIFSNSGGDVSMCSVSPALPDGLSFGLVNQDSDIASCALSGTPTTASASAAYSLRFESAFAPIELSLTLLVEEALAAPVLADLPIQNFEPSEANIEAIVFANSGGAELSGCSSVPDINENTPFSLAPSSDGTTCVITGAPISPLEQQSFTVTATNASGSGSATVSLAVVAEQEAPILSDASFRILLLGQEIDPIVFNNSGDAIEECSELDFDPLPEGLNVSVDEELDICEVFGAPTELVQFQSFTIEASNEAGFSNASVDLGVYSAPVFGIVDGSAISLNVNDEAFFEELLVSSGELDGDLECFVTPALPTGATFTVNAEATNCELSIATDSPIEATAHTFTAQNTATTSSVSLRLEVLQLIVSESIEIPFSNLDGVISMSFRLSSGDLTVDWGESEEATTYLFEDTTNGVVSLSYEPDFSGDDTLTLSFSEGFATLTEIRTSGSSSTAQPGLLLSTEILANFENLQVLSMFNGELSGDLSELSNLTALNQIVMADAGSMVVEISDLPDSVVWFQINGISNTVVGDLADVNANMERLILSNLVDVTGDFADLAPLSNLQFVTISTGTTSIVGDIGGIPEGVEAFVMSSTNQGEIFGDIANLPRSLESFTLSSENSIMGNVEDLGPNLAAFAVEGSNEIGGDLARLQSDFIRSFSVSGNNTINTFSVEPLWTPLNLVTLALSGNGETGFASADLDRLLEHFAANLIATTSSTASIDISREIDAAPSFNADPFIREIEALGYDVFVNSEVEFEASELAF